MRKCAEFYSSCVQVRPEDPIVWLADWLLVNNPNKAGSPS